MERNTSALTEREHDVVVVGGGIFGAAIAWEAASRGLQVALVERQDFAHATSANHFKMVHGGIRYMQHGDVARIRESVRERRALLRIAPHLVEPLPILIPTYGHGMKGKAILSTGMRLYDLLAIDRNRGISDPSRRIPAGRSVSRGECLDRFPGLERQGLTGGALFYDAQMYNPPRLVLAFLKSAVAAGAGAVNYVDAKRLQLRNGRVVGVEVEDVLSGDRFVVRGKVVINAAGPWAEQWLTRAARRQLSPPSTFSRDACFIVPRRLTQGPCALAVSGRTRDPDAILSRDSRHLFLVPWRGSTLVGVWHVVHRGTPEDFRVTEEDLRGFIDEVNGAYAALQLSLDDVYRTNAGLTLFGTNQPGATNLSYGKRSRLVDHRSEHGIEGLITVVGVRATVARGVAEKAIDLAFRKLGSAGSPSRSETIPLVGGEIARMDDLLADAQRRRLPGTDERAIRSLVRNYGSEYRQVMAHAREDPALASPIEGSDTMRAEIVHAVREEMAQTLSDVVLRRTDLGTGQHPGEEALRTCAALMAEELGWSEARISQETEAVDSLIAQPTIAGVPTAIPTY